MVIHIPLSKHGKNRGKYVAIVDDCDSDLDELSWSYQKKYAMCKPEKHFKSPSILMHRVILERMLPNPLGKGQYVDHISGDTLDNRRENLRLATRSQNGANRSKQPDNKSGYKGVSWDKQSGKYKAQICINKKKIGLGYFDTPELAYETYCEKAIELFGEFARLE